MSVAFAPSGNLVASGGLDNMCTVYNIKAASPKTLRELDAHTGDADAKNTEFPKFPVNNQTEGLINVSLCFLLRISVLRPFPQRH